MGDRFVGYQERIKVPASMKPVEVKEHIACNQSTEELFHYISDAELLSQWFYPISKLNLKQGGEISFRDFDGGEQKAVCTSVDLGKSVSMVSDLFGNLTMSVEAGAITLTFQILSESPDFYISTCTSYIERLSALVAS